MGQNQDVKELRKQLRNIVRELLPELLSQEQSTAIKKELQVQIEDRLKKIDQHVQDSMKSIDSRSKDVQAYIMRQINSELTKLGGKAHE